MEYRGGAGWRAERSPHVRVPAPSREQILTDALETCYGLLRTQYLAYVAGLMAAADTWQRAEVCLFAIRCVALSVKSRVLSGAALRAPWDSPGGTRPPARAPLWLGL